MRSDFEVHDPAPAADVAAPHRDGLSPEPILAAIDNYRGVFVDLDQHLVVDAAALAAGRVTLTRKLLASGLRAGDRAVVAIGNGPLFVTMLAATLEIGASPLLVHYQLPPAELKRTAARYGAVMILTDNCEPAEVGAFGREYRLLETPWLPCAQVLMDVSDAAFCRDYPALPAVPLHPTSGSTGLPKIAIRPGASAIAEADHYIDATGIDHADSLLVVTPMSHAYAYGMGLMVPLVSGATVLSMRRFVLKGVLRALDEFSVTVFPAVPAMLDMLLFGKGGELLSRPRMVLSAGVPLTRRTAETFRKVTGRLVCPLYGTTETGGITVGSEGMPPEQVDHVGPPMRGVEARIEPAEGAVFGEGIGRVAIRSSSMMAGYLSPTGVDPSGLNDGWFVTGDLGRFGTNGALQLLGRESEMINVSGMKVAPSEVEEVLNLFPGVLDCKVYAGQRRPGNQFVKAVVVGAPSLDLELLKTHCQDQLVYYKRPQVITRLDAMPRSPAGKILKDQLP